MARSGSRTRTGGNRSDRQDHRGCGGSASRLHGSALSYAPALTGERRPEREPPAPAPLRYPLLDGPGDLVLEFGDLAGAPAAVAGVFCRGPQGVRPRVVAVGQPCDAVVVLAAVVGQVASGEADTGTPGQLRLPFGAIPFQISGTGFSGTPAIVIE